jgi:Protein of unknown function (DUF3300)
MISAGLFAILMVAAPAPEMMIPEGTILPVVLNETLNTAKIQENDPVLFTLAEDIRAAGHRGPVLIPRGSSVVGRIVMTDRAGHFFGRSAMDIRLQEIITPSGEVYDGVSTKIVDTIKKKGQKAVVKSDGALQGPGHAKRDTFFLLFPPTTVFQLLATPKRGPDIVLPIETRLQVKLMSPIYVETQTKVAAVATPAPVPVATMPAQPLPAPQLVASTPQPVSGNGLENLVAPVALYPDAILRDLFRATARPYEMLQANLWVHQVRDVNGSLPLSGYNDSWDPSVKAITAYPELLQRLTTDAEWMAKLGATYVAQPVEVLSAVQRVRVRSQSVRNAAAIF